jgi:hypothetical protein
MITLNPLHLCAWHLIRLILYRTHLQPRHKVAFEPEWVPEICSTIHRRIKFPFQLVSVLLAFSCLMAITSFSYAIFWSVTWWFMLSFVTLTTTKNTGQFDIVICCCSLMLYWLRAYDWNRSRQPIASTIECQVLSFSSVMLCGIMLMDLSMDLFPFSRVPLADSLVRVSRYYTLLFQIRINYVAYILLILQPLTAIYGYFFMSLPFVAMSFTMILIVCLGLATVWNVLIVNIFHYSKVEMITPGTQQRLPDTFDYLLCYQFLTLIHCAMFIALITTLFFVDF